MADLAPQNLVLVGDSVSRRSNIIGVWGVGVGLLGGALLAIFVPRFFGWSEWSGVPIYLVSQILSGWIGTKRAEHLAPREWG